MASLNQLTVFPLPPLTPLANIFKSKVAVPFPESHSSKLVPVAEGLFPIIKSIGVIGELQLPSVTTAYTVVVLLEKGVLIGVFALTSLNQLTIFPLPPFTSLASIFKSKVAVPEPSSHCSLEIAFAVSPAPTSRLTATGEAVHVPSVTMA